MRLPATMPWGYDNFMRLIPSLTYQPDPPLDRVVERVASGSVCLDLGAGGRNLGKGIIPVDFVAFPGTQVCADVQRLPFSDSSVDLVIGTGLIEHVADDLALMRETLRVLKPTGTLHLEVPFLQNEHADPIDSRRFTLAGFEALFRQCGFEVESSGVHIGPTVTMLTTATYYISLFFEGESKVARVLSMGAFIVCSVVFWPFKFLDRWLIKKPRAERLAFGVYVTARVPSIKVDATLPVDSPGAREAALLK